MKLVRGPSKSMLQWLCLFGNINQFSFYILGSRTKVFRCTLEEWFSFSSSFFFYFFLHGNLFNMLTKLFR